MNHIFEQIENIKANPPIKDLFVYEFPGTTRKKILEAVKKFELKLPEDYICFLERSNGMSFWEYYDCRIFDIDKAVSLSLIDDDLTQWLKKKKLLLIGSFYEDSIYMDCSNGEGLILASFEGIDEPKSLGLDFKGFLQKCIDNNFQVFWDDIVYN